MTRFSWVRVSGAVLLVALLAALLMLVPSWQLSPATVLASGAENVPIGQIIFVGDSLTAGSQATDPYPSQIMRKFDPAVRWQNLGVGGMRIKDMLDLAPARVDLRYNSRLGRNVVVVWGGTNDVALWNHMAGTVYHRIREFCLERRQQGFTVLVLTMLPRNDKICQPGFEERRQAINRRLRLSWSDFADGIVDVAADPRIGTAGCENDYRYWVQGGVHLTNKGLSIVATDVRKALITLENPVVQAAD